MKEGPVFIGAFLFPAGKKRTLGLSPKGPDS